MLPVCDIRGLVCYMSLTSEARCDCVSGTEQDVTGSTRITFCLTLPASVFEYFAASLKLSGTHTDLQTCRCTQTHTHTAHTTHTYFSYSFVPLEQQNMSPFCPVALVTYHSEHDECQ